MTRGKAMEHSFGPMDDNTLENGKQVSSTELAPISVRRDKRSKANGKMEERSSGWTRNSETKTSCSHEHSIFDRESHSLQ